MCIGLAVMAGIFIALAGPSSAVVTASSPGLAPPWWLPLPLPVAFVTSLLWTATLVGAIGVGAGLMAVARGARPPVRLLITAGLLAAAVFTVLPAAGSSDTLDYAAYGRMAVLGYNPYQMTPLELRLTGDPVGRATPQAWQGDPSDYGPLATLEQAAAAELGGTATGRTIFWLKLWNALAFGLVVLVLDRLLRADPVRRARAHLLWTVNPLLLWGLLASGHVDAVAAACGLLAVSLVRRWSRGQHPRLPYLVLAGLLVGAAADFKITYAMFGLGVAWMTRTSWRGLACAGAAALAAVVPVYLSFGGRAVTVLMNHRDATPDTLYRVLGDSFLQPSLPQVLLVVLPVLAVTTVLLFRGLPDSFAELPAIHPAFVFSLAWLLAWPYQRPWYDAAVFCLLAFYRAGWLDGLLLAQLAVSTLELMPGMPAFPPAHGWLATAVRTVQVTYLVPGTRLAVLVGVTGLCVLSAGKLSARKTAAWIPGPAARAHEGAR